MTTVRLASIGGLEGENGFGHRFPGERPALLVSFVYLKPFVQWRPKYAFRDWVLDSGAFSAHMIGTDIPLQRYINACKAMLANDTQLTEVFSLDVIGDWKASLKNCEEMWRQGVPAIPCYHHGEPEHVLKTMASNYPKLALGGVARMMSRRKNEWAKQCFARIWPKPIHGFGFGAESGVMEMPFHSVDATSWQIRPWAFGQWNAYGGPLSVRGKKAIRPEVEWYLDLELRAKAKWSGELSKLKYEPRRAA